MNRSESIENIAKAMTKVQQDIKQPEKSGYNPHFKSKYVQLEGVIGSLKKTLADNGLSYMQETITNEFGHIGVRTIVMHETGEWMEFEPLFLPNEKKTAQGAGSAITYARRYSLSAIFGIASDEDDDGNNASEPRNLDDMTLEHAQKVMLTFGKNKGKNIQQIANEDMSYLRWLYRQERTDAEIKKAIELVGVAMKQSHEEASPLAGQRKEELGDLNQ